MKIDITPADHTSIIVALDFFIRDDLRIRRHESARLRLKKYIALQRKLDLANHNSFALKPLKTFAQLRAKRLAWQKERKARQAAPPVVTIIDDPVTLDTFAHDGRGNVVRPTLTNAGLAWTAAA